MTDNAELCAGCHEKIIIEEEETKCNGTCGSYYHIQCSNVAAVHPEDKETWKCDECMPHYEETESHTKETNDLQHDHKNEDWFVQTPTLQLKRDLDISSLAIKETLGYFVSCSDRLRQMKKTYNDINAVTMLLEEKEHDIELAATIGLSLLEQNEELRERNEQLKHDLTVANDIEQLLNQEIKEASEEVTQLRHELILKSDLLRIYKQDLSTGSEAGSSPEKSLEPDWEEINKKIQFLQEENNQLRNLTAVRENSIENEEKIETQLVNDCVRKISEKNLRITSLQEEVVKKTNETVRQQEEIAQLLSHIVDLQSIVQDLTAENEVFCSKVKIAEECQQELSTELIEMKENYKELLIALQELQEEARKARHSKMPKVSKLNYCTYSSSINPNSLASELENALTPQSNDYSSDEKSLRNKKAFDTVKYANFSGTTYPQSRYNPRSLYIHNPSLFSFQSNYFSHSPLSSASTCNENQTSESASAFAAADDVYQSSVSNKDKLDFLGSNSTGVAQTQLSSDVGTTDLNSKDEMTHACCQTLDSKLQIIKPLEGSQTLHRWQHLATPHLGGIFESHPGVQIKGEVKLEDEDKFYTLSDLEEDEELCYPGKSFTGTSSVYTYTNSTILHPCGQTGVTPNHCTSQIPTQAASHSPSSVNTPQQQQNETATSIFSTTQSLVKLLNERNIHAVKCTATTSREDLAPIALTPPSSSEDLLLPTRQTISQALDLFNSISLSRCLELLSTAFSFMWETFP